MKQKSQCDFPTISQCLSLHYKVIEYLKRIVLTKQVCIASKYKNRKSTSNALLQVSNVMIKVVNMITEKSLFYKFLCLISSFLILGDYSGVIIELHLKRRFLYYIIQMYLPAVMVVMLSWVCSSFLAIF